MKQFAACNFAILVIHATLGVLSLWTKMCLCLYVGATTSRTPRCNTNPIIPRSELMRAPGGLLSDTMAEVIYDGHCTCQTVSSTSGQLPLTKYHPPQSHWHCSSQCSPAVPGTITSLLDGLVGQLLLVLAGANLMGPYVLSTMTLGTPHSACFSGGVNKPRAEGETVVMCPVLSNTD